MSSACSSNCMMSLTPFLASSIAFWSFEGSLSDKNNIYPVSTSDSSSASYRAAQIGQGVQLSSRYLYSNARFMNLSYQSWTIEA